ncbi:Adenylate cyclase [Acidisarcina polymorpha]|uniref:Adenylate cyclase n=1 Tax=Acidisarcina polymorpha TaxID=2211140 RepID=A0A2Z5G6Z4_9BACT|nr:tetratricopeptide repeat protein [Acidisarcina polymorpha]AXC14464.1 Adenylate cyclase [Acidisarcina polymorpha]
MAPQLLRFRDFELKVSSYELRRNGEPIKLERIPMELLILLVEQRGDLVSRETIIQRLWGSDTFLETEHSINTAINKLRGVLQDHPRQPAYIQTVVGKGYRFIAEVKVVEVQPSEPPLVELFSPSLSAPVVSAPEISTSNGATSTANLNPLPATKESLQEPTSNQTSADQPLRSENAQIPQSSAEPGLLANPGLPAGTEISVEPRLPADPGTPAGPELPTRPKAILWRQFAILFGFLAVFLPLIVYLLHRERSPTAKPPPPPAYQSVAVLPFVDLSPNSTKEYLVDGMTDELITLLAKGTSLRVISRTSTMQFKGAKKSLPEIASALNVDAVVEGSVTRSGGKMRIVAQLVDARKDQHLWAQTYERDEGEPLDNQDKVAADIALNVGERLTNRTPTIEQQTADPRARDLFLRGGYLWHQRTLQGLTRSISYYKQAIEIDPNFADAYAALGKAEVILSSYGGPGPSKSLLDARAAAERALELNPRLGEAHTVLAVVKLELDWDWNGAEAEFRQALELSPDDPTAHHWYALHLARMRRYPEARAQIQQALDLDPASVILRSDAAEIEYSAGDIPAALARVQSALELDENFAQAHLQLGKVYELQGKFPDALAEYQHAAQLFGNTPNALALIGHALAGLGRKTEAQAIADRLEAESKTRYVSAVDIAIVYCALGETDNAMRLLRSGLERRDKGMNILGSDPLFQGCESDPRFQDLLKQLKLR